MRARKHPSWYSTAIQADGVTPVCYISWQTTAGLFASRLTLLLGRRYVSRGVVDTVCVSVVRVLMLTLTLSLITHSIAGWRQRSKRNVESRTCQGGGSLALAVWCIHCVYTQ